MGTTIDIANIQATLKEGGLDAWLLYDFHGSNPIARRIVGLNNSPKLTTRRWYYLIPAEGIPCSLVHHIEKETLAHLPGTRRLYAERNQLSTELTRLVSGLRHVAMEYSPHCAIPYLSRVDAGTVDSLRALNIEVISSGDLVQQFEATWDLSALESHYEAAAHLYRIKDRAFSMIQQNVSDGNLTEYSVQEKMVNWFTEAGLISDSPPVVAVGNSSADPHYLPTVTGHRSIGMNELILLDLWGKLKKPGAVFADITWVGYTGKSVPVEYASVFSVARDARDAAVALVSAKTAAGQELSGWEVDRAARSVIDSAGYADYFVHRTGHSLGEMVHGNGVHMDDYETHDERKLLPGTGFTIEPGIYLERFGIRTEINMYIGQGESNVTGPQQQEIIALC